MNVKQVLVIRRDLGMRRGKEIAQGSHASMAWLVNRIKLMDHPDLSSLFRFSEAESEWMNGLFTKVTLQVDSEAALCELHEKALAAGLESNLITDAGKTEFGGVPTITALGIGPDLAEKIDPITSHLKLY